MANQAAPIPDGPQRQETNRFPIGATVTVDRLAGPEAPQTLARLSEAEPVSWLPAIDGWLVTGRDPALAVLRDAERFTVDDPRFTTGQVVGPSMLSLDGQQHRRHRSPFVGPFRAGPVDLGYTEPVEQRARQLVAELKPRGRAELRTGLAGPLAVAVIADVLGLEGADHNDVLAWYREIVDGVVALSDGRTVSPATTGAVQSLRDRVLATLAPWHRPDGEAPDGVSGAGGLLRRVQASSDLTRDELFSNAAVLMFGAIETSEGMTTNALWHLLSHPEQLAEVRAKPDELLDRAIDESLRLEPAAAVVDRYATVDTSLETSLGPAPLIRAGDLVRVSLTAVNRQPDRFDRPNRFDIHRPNAADHLSFVQGPHTCLGAHLARLETRSALAAVIELLPDPVIDPTGTSAPSGLIFRKPDRLTVTWSAD